MTDDIRTRAEQMYARGAIPEEIAARLGVKLARVIRIGEAMDDAAYEKETIPRFEPAPGRRRKCKAGHYLTRENTTAGYECRACKNRRAREAYNQQKEAS